MTTLRETYVDEIRPRLLEEGGYSSIMAVPKVTKVTLNMGVGEAVGDRKLIETSMNDLMLISGQKPVITNARKSIAAFKIRTGYPIGVKVTLRRVRMYEFLERLVNIAIPRMRDFRGLSPRAFDGRGNFSMGVTEQIIFPEIDYDRIDKIRGLNIAVSTSAKTDEEGLALLQAFNFPFRAAGQA